LVMQLKKRGKNRTTRGGDFNRKRGREGYGYHSSHVGPGDVAWVWGEEGLKLKTQKV